MSQPRCDACTELRENAPGFVLGGVTDSVAASLINNTGVSFRNTNCEDLKDVVDCLIGRKVEELEKLDVCDWKDFMAGLGPNLYETLKAMVMDDCGQWNRIMFLCDMLTYIQSPPVNNYGVWYDPSENDVGHIVLKDGSPIIEPLPNSEVPDYQKNLQYFGISYGQYLGMSCDSGGCKRYTWIAPASFLFRSTSKLRAGDDVWYCGKQEWQSATGMTDAEFTQWGLSSWTWYNYTLLGARRTMWWTLHVDKTGKYGEDSLVITYSGTNAPNDPPGTNMFGQMPFGVHYRGTYPC